MVRRRCGGWAVEIGPLVSEGVGFKYLLSRVGVDFLLAEEKGTN